MKKILVPTDFSDNANNALRYAINIANYFDAEVDLLNVYQVGITSGSYETLKEYIKEGAERDLADNIRSFQKSVLGKTILKGRVLEGNTIDSICSIAKNESIDLIVMGTQGATGLKEFFLGSKTYGVMTHSHVPILAVPNHFKYRPIKDIIFPVDSGIVSDDDILNPLLELAKSYKSNVKVVHLETEKIVVGYDPGIDVSLENIPHSFHRISGSNDVNGVVDLFVYEENADMLCMIRRERGFWRDLFHRSVTSKEIFHSPVPLLILHAPS